MGATLLRNTRSRVLWSGVLWSRGTGERMAQRDQVDLQGALRQSVVPLSVKALKKKGVKRVKVIERDRLLKALMQAVDQKLADRAVAGVSPETPGERKRVELLLIELERVSKVKTTLEHDKGILEADRSRLS